MSKKSKNKGFVYSTNPDFHIDSEDSAEETLPPNEQLLEVHLEKKQRAGKIAILVKGFVGAEEDLKELAKDLKAACGVGGSVKDGEILIQGDKREKVMEVLAKKGFKTKRVGG